MGCSFCSHCVRKDARLEVSIETVSQKVPRLDYELRQLEDFIDTERTKNIPDENVCHYSEERTLVDTDANIVLFEGLLYRKNGSTLWGKMTDTSFQVFNSKFYELFDEKPLYILPIGNLKAKESSPKTNALFEIRLKSPADKKFSAECIQVKQGLETRINNDFPLCETTDHSYFSITDLSSQRVCPNTEDQVSFEVKNQEEWAKWKESLQAALSQTMDL